MEDEGEVGARDVVLNRKEKNIRERSGFIRWSCGRKRRKRDESGRLK
jgi:hypothetical protein